MILIKKNSIIYFFDIKISKILFDILGYILSYMSIYSKYRWINNELSKYIINNDYNIKCKIY